MTVYTYIKALFTAILAQSSAIEGRFYMSYRYGAQEINSDELGELVTEISEKKYPLALMPPPTSRGTYTENRKGQWERFRIIIFFVKQQFYGPGANIDPDTRISQHSVVEDWDDMARAAKAFKSKLDLSQKLNRYYRVPDNQGLIHPVSSQGTDRIAGVKFDFDFDLFIGPCDGSEDYDTFTIPVIDTNQHQEHEL